MKQLIKSILFLLVISAEPSFSKILRRYYYTGYLYEGFTKNTRKIDFADTSPDEWKDLNGLTKKYGLKGKGLFCANGVGAWLSYPMQNFNHGSLVYHLIVGERCVPTDTVNSLQPVGYIYGFHRGGIAYFSSTYFASKANLFDDQSPTVDMKSLIIVGNDKWTLKGTGKNGPVNICILRDQLMERVCILPDLGNQLGLTSSKVTMTRGCAAKINRYYLQTCYSEGNHRITHEFQLDKSMMKEVCTSADKDKSSATKFNAIMEVWSSRISKGAEEYGTIAIQNPNAHYKVDFLMEVVDIFAASCPRVSKMYLSLLGNVYLMHMRPVWANSSMVNRKPDQNWIEAWDFLQHCGGAVNSMASRAQPNLAISCRPRDPSTMKTEHEELAMEMMHQSATFDPVIEQIWLILNFVSPYCSFVDGYRNNLWNDFPALFKKHYLLPVQEQWRTPKDWSTYYPSMFHGFNMKFQHEGILSCVQSALHLTPFLDPVGRTGIFDDAFWKNPLSTVAMPPSALESLNSSNKKETTTNPPVLSNKDEASSGRSVVYRPGKNRGRAINLKGQSIIKKQGRGMGKRGRRIGKGKRGRKIGKGLRKKGRKIKIRQHPVKKTEPLKVVESNPPVAVPTPAVPTPKEG